jgi:hypothetical protein
MAASKQNRSDTPKASSSTAGKIAGFLGKYSPDLARSARAMRAWMRRRMPGGFEFVYDNYNFLVFGYGPCDRPSDAVLSLAVAPRWVTLCFLRGVDLHDPRGLLRGGGSLVRNIRLTGPGHLAEPDVEALISQAIARADPAFPGGGAPRTVIRSISAKQRPRRPRGS